MAEATPVVIAPVALVVPPPIAPGHHQGSDDDDDNDGGEGGDEEDAQSMDENRAYDEFNDARQFSTPEFSPSEHSRGFDDPIEIENLYDKEDSERESYGSAHSDELSTGEHRMFTLNQRVAAEIDRKRETRRRGAGAAGTSSPDRAGTSEDSQAPIERAAEAPASPGSVIIIDDEEDS